MRPHHFARGNLTLLVLTLGLPVVCAAQQSELLWTFDTKG
jgi:hypothetical protein